MKTVGLTARGVAHWNVAMTTGTSLYCICVLVSLHELSYDCSKTVHILQASLAKDQTVIQRNLFCEYSLQYCYISLIFCEHSHGNEAA